MAGMEAGLARMGWPVPGTPAVEPARHGALMVAGFLGTLVSLERAAGLGRNWAYGVVGLAALGSVLLLAQAPVKVAALLFSSAGVGLAAIFMTIYRIRPGRATAVLLAGSLAWLGGNLAWLAGQPLVRVVPCWVSFLALTIAGERLELAHLRPARSLVDAAFLASALLLGVGALASLASAGVGVRLAGAGMAGLGLWLMRYDIARRTVRLSGLTRYIAWCLLPGYGWLTLAGLAWVAWADRFGSGMFYDAMLHAVFVGFVMSMILGHAPVILPGVMGVDLAFYRRFYLHLVLLHGSLVVRVIGDVIQSLPARQWGGMLNVAAVLIFLLQTVLAVQRGGRPAPS